VVLKRVLDTNAILYLLGGKLAQTLPAGEYFISLISEMELLSYPLLDESEQAKIRDFLSAVTVVDLTQEVKSLAIRLRREHLLKLPDAIVASTALTIGASLITNDVKLLRVPGLSSQVLKLKNE
jgi:predicted nucleic acid-binding protein